LERASEATRGDGDASVNEGAVASEDDNDGSSGDDEELGLDEDDPGAHQQVLKMEDVRILHDTRFSVDGDARQI
jgi:hypothetical protein